MRFWICQNVWKMQKFLAKIFKNCQLSRVYTLHSTYSRAQELFYKSKQVLNKLVSQKILSADFEKCAISCRDTRKIKNSFPVSRFLAEKLATLNSIMKVGSWKRNLFLGILCIFPIKPILIRVGSGNETLLEGEVLCFVPEIKMPILKKNKFCF